MNACVRLLFLASVTTCLGVAGCVLQPVAEPPGAVTAPDPESIGSLRNARVALAGAKEKQVTFVAGGMSDTHLAELRAMAPNLTVQVARSRAEALRLAPGAHAVDARFADAEFIAAAPNLVWVQAMSAGVDHLVTELQPVDRVVLTNMRAVHGPAIADHSFAMLLTLTRNMRQHVADQAREHWPEGRAEGTRPIALHGRTMLVVGLGGIGTEVARRADAFGMRVEAIRRSDTPGPAYVAKTGHPDDLHAMLPDADVVAICLPLTDETRGMFGERELDLMKDDAILINIGRGPIVDTEALLGALNEGRLGGACLDVTDPEPLPPGHPLWKQARVIITPHCSADAEITGERRWTILRENLRRFAAGEPLLNVVDKAAGY